MKLLKSYGLFLAGALLTYTCVAAEHTTTTKTSFIRASNIKGARINFQGGGEAGTIQDVALDPNTGCARFVMIESGGHTVAAPFRVLHGSGGGAYTITVDRERLMSAPVVNVDRVDEWSDPGFVDRVYSYYGENASETNISVNQGERGFREHGRNAETRGREGERGTAGNEKNRENAQRGQANQASPVPVGEHGNRRGRNNARGAESPSAEASPSPGTSSQQRERSRAREQASPGTNAERSSGGALSSPSSAAKPANSPASENLRSHENAAPTGRSTERGATGHSQESSSPTSQRHSGSSSSAGSPSNQNQ